MRSISVHLEQLTLDLGLWCSDCNLGSGVRVWFTVSTPGRMALGSKVGCCDCGGANVTG